MRKSLLLIALMMSSLNALSRGKQTNCCQIADALEDTTAVISDFVEGAKDIGRGAKKDTVPGLCNTYIVENIAGAMINVYDVKNSDILLHFWFEEDGMSAYYPDAVIVEKSYRKAICKTFAGRRRKEIFPPKERSNIFITTVADPKTGAILEVSFYFTIKPGIGIHGALSMSLQEIELFEKNIKSFVKCDVPENSRKYTYCVGYRRWTRRDWKRK